MRKINKFGFDCIGVSLIHGITLPIHFLGMGLHAPSAHLGARAPIA
ncbi:MAG: hypothetical protein ABIG46_07560 [Candidatus Omnitrophota bacterium]